MLCGEFGAAVAASNLGNQAIWLQNPFEYPDIITNSIFAGVPIDGSNSWRYWNDPNNPIDNFDTAQSVIEDNQHNKIRVTIDY